MKKFEPTWTAFTKNEKIGKTIFANINRPKYNPETNDKLTHELVVMGMKNKATYQDLVNHYKSNKVTFIHNVIKFPNKK